MTLYLSRLEPNLRSRKVRRDLDNAYELHRTLARGVAENEQRILWRVEQGKPPHVIIQTLSEPDWSYLEEDVPPTYLLASPKVKAVTLSLLKDQILRFRLRANPTVKRTVGEDKKRLALYSEDDQIAWFHRKAESAGFRPLEAPALSSELVAFKREGSLVTINAVNFDGLLCVVDPEALRLAVQSGIGSAKGFGMGLLSLAAPS